MIPHDEPTAQRDRKTADSDRMAPVTTTGGSRDCLVAFPLALGQDACMGYAVRLIKGEVVIPAAKSDAALSAIRELDAHGELKGGWSRDKGDVKHPHWSFTSPARIAAASSLEDMLRAFRFAPILEPDGELYGVEFVGENRGDELHLWTVLAPFVDPGGEMIWLGEDDLLYRWTFDGKSLSAQDGRMKF